MDFVFTSIYVDFYKEYTALKHKMGAFLQKKYKFPAVLIALLCSCMNANSIKRMDRFDAVQFNRRYYGKKPVVISNAKGYFENATTSLFTLCKDEIIYLARLPAMEEDLVDIPLTKAFAPCGADCYGVYEAKVCSGIEEMVNVPDDFPQTVKGSMWFNIAQQGKETPGIFLAGHYFRFLTAGVEDWRLLLDFDGEVNLFTQKVYSDKIVAGDLLYVPPDTLAQHSALTPLSVAIGTTS